MTAQASVVTSSIQHCVYVHSYLVLAYICVYICVYIFATISVLFYLFLSYLRCLWFFFCEVTHIPTPKGLLFDPVHPKVVACMHNFIPPLDTITQREGHQEFECIELIFQGPVVQAAMQAALQIQEVTVRKITTTSTKQWTWRGVTRQRG